MYPLLATLKETDLIPITGLLVWLKAGPLAFLVAIALACQGVWKSHKQIFFHVVPGHNSHNM